MMTRRLACLALASASLAHAQEPAWPRDEAMLVYFQAAAAIREHALSDYAFTDIVHESLRLFVERHDPYSRFFSPTEYSRYKAAQHETYHGIGMELAQTRDGSFYCIPYPGSPAERAGIREEDILLAIDGQFVTNRPLEVVGALVRGKPQTALNLTLRSRNGAERTLTAERAQIRPPSAANTTQDGIPMVRIYTFNAGTPADLRNAISALPDQQPIVIDLRGNHGGNLFDAVDAARLFLAPTQTMVEVRGRTGNTVYRSDRPATFPDRPVWLLQDEGTASAAEVFVAALVENGRARSLGQPTFGKAHTQRIVELMDGSALLLTNGELIPPSGKPFSAVGLSPSIPADADSLLPTLRKRLPK